MPRVSVIIPTYNRAELVQEAVDSVLAQTYRDFEIIVVDDGSIDATATELERYGSGIRYLRQQNRGVGAARNAGIRASVGDFIAFLDSDDLYLPRRLEVGVKALDLNPDFGASYVDARILDADGKVWVPSHLQRCQCCPSGWIFDTLLRRQLLMCNTLTIRRHVLERCGLFGEEFHSGEDTTFFWRLARACQIVGVPEVLVVGREIRGSLSDFRQGVSRHLELLASWAAGEQSFLETAADLSLRQKRLLARRVWSLHLQRARFLSRLQRRPEARDAALQARAIALGYHLVLPGVHAALARHAAPMGRTLLLPFQSCRPSARAARARQRRETNSCPTIGGA